MTIISDKGRSRRRKHKTLTPRLRTVTLALYEQACEALGMDPDASTESVINDVGKLHDVSMSNMVLFVDLVLENGRDYKLDDVEKWTPAGARQFVAMVAAFFLRESLTNLSEGESYQIKHVSDQISALRLQTTTLSQALQP